MSDPTITVVVIDDDKTIRRFIRTHLEADGMSVFDAQTGAQGLAQAATRLADLVIIDPALTDREGIDVIRELRGWSAMPVIVLSARSREEDKVAALDAGADDYLTKPFGLPELGARIRAHLRRQIAGGRVGSPEVRFGLVTVDLAERRVLRDSRVVHLSPTEYRLLAALVRRPGHVLTHEQLLGEVWGPLQINNHHYLRIYMGHLRHKLERDPARPEHIVTESGVGYRLVGVR
ncbi:response regulator with CheY-like receiver domain and winged-helix DNA-binding domain [Burkholderia sp. Ch1-1]|uniref:DNA-binding response regulator in two-component regulatory system with KdpD n=1 Tax=Paraburkholderia dioscoreae TaxID=2604047 RepID=A0A5Q4ZBT4_9BURK|nr:response regulator [Paraburkholderia dioscoreae]EIF33576.1 response regulator with CheY-like receiver domain and winged-helix DNA-binding domain [Burkholderia sp. Ch1-1]VVD32439.1 DNA-binding response regulator in two-component regulatory system with KdpD [Paraburkholderia dioscoreae]